MAELSKPTPVGGPAERPSRRLSLSTFAAFGSAPFRLLWLNTFSFTLVNGIQRFAFIWLALEISERSITLGVVSFALGAPILFVSLPAGVLIDRVDRRLILFGSQILGLVGSLVAAALIWIDAMSIGLTLATALILGLAVAVGQPARQAIVPSIVEPRRLLNAITLTSLSQNLSQMAGPAIGGATIAIWGVGGSFAAQAALLSVGLLALIPLRVPAPAAREERGRPRWQTDIAEGLRFVATSPNIRVLIILLVISALITAGTWSTLLPKLARDELGVGAFGASALFALMGIGTLLSSLVLASMGEIKNGGGWFIVTMMIGSSMMVGLGLSTVYELSLLLMFVSGCNAGFFMNLNLTLIQANTPQPVMGRVMSIYTLGFMGGIPLGALLAGFGADIVGAPMYFAACGLANALFAGGAILTQPQMRRMSTLGGAPAGAEGRAQRLGREAG